MNGKESVEGVFHGKSTGMEPRTDELDRTEKGVITVLKWAESFGRILSRRRIRRGLGRGGIRE